MVGPDDRGPPGGAGPDDARIRTFLIADVRGYTLFTQERGDEAAAKLAARFADVVREVVEARGGTLLELRGDEALCVFASAREAIRTAVDLQMRCVEETIARPELPLTIGIGLDAGEAVSIQGGYRGGALNLAARLCGEARAGEILASREVTHLARRLDGVRYEDRGSLTFKNIPDPVAVIRIAPEAGDPAERLRPFTPTAPPAPERRSKGWPIAIGIAVVFAVVAISIPLLGSDEPEGIEIGTDSIARLDAEDGGVELAAPLGQRPGASAVGFGSLWVAEPDRGVVARLDLGDGSVRDTIRVGNSPAGVAIGDGSVWVTNAGDGTVSRINVETNEVSQTLRAGSGPSGIAFGDGALWVADTVGTALLRLDPNSQDVTTVPLSGQPSGVVVAEEGVWVSVAPNSVARIDPADASVTLTQTVGNGPTAVLDAYGSIWVANHLDATLSRLEPSTGRVVSTIPVREGPNAVAAAAGSLWVANEFDDSISEIDPATNAVARTMPVGGAAASLVSDGPELWLAVGASVAEHRGGTLTVSSGRVTSLDPAIVYDVVGWQILTITNDGLLAYKKVGGPDGATLVPDLASALPEVSSDGLTYRFALRDGITYSTGEPLRPEDFRHAIERVLILGPAAGLYLAIDGAEACTEGPDSCDLSDSIVADEGSVTFHLATPDPDLPFKLALPFAFPVPSGTPAEDQALDPLPATGPYVVSRATRDGIELVRNPGFREWSGAAQPDGFVDAISFRFEEDPADAYDSLTGGELDLMLDAPAPQDLAILRSTHPDQVVSWPSPLTMYVGFDVRKPPFDDERVRQALNYAIDRNHIVDLLGGSTIQRVTCQILPPNFQGYAPFCPFTLDPASNVWSAPDVDRARALMQAADVGREDVLVWVTEDLPPGAVEVMRYITETLRDLGARAELEIVPDADTYFTGIYPPSGDVPGVWPGTAEHPHVYMTGWAADYPGAGNFIEPQFGCGGFGNTSGWCDRSLDARIDDALLLSGTDPGAANRAWMEIEHGLVEEGALVALTNSVTTHAISDRVGNVQVSPQWGVMLSRIWVE